MTSIAARETISKEAEHRAHRENCLECRSFCAMNPTWPYSPMCTQGRDLWEAWQPGEDDGADAESIALRREAAVALVQNPLTTEVARLRDIIRRMDEEMLPVTCGYCERQSRVDVGMDASEWERFMAEASA